MQSGLCINSTKKFKTFPPKMISVKVTSRQTQLPFLSNSNTYTEHMHTLEQKLDEGSFSPPL